MNILFVGGYFEGNVEEKIVKKNNSYVEYTANLLQKNIIDGLTEVGHNVKVVSAPFTGSWPNQSKIKHFNKNKFNSNINYVSFYNIWGLRNISRYNSLRKYLKKQRNIDYILVYSSHTPFLKAAREYKTKYGAKILLILPDLPEYMNLANKKSFFYKYFKKKDIKEFYTLNKEVDYYMLLTEQMNDRVNVKRKKPYLIVEGITNKIFPKMNSIEIKKPTIVTYTGKLEKSFGVDKLLESVLNSNITSDELVLKICGSGELGDKIENISKKDSRIEYLGFVPYQHIEKIIEESDILINPRTGESEFSKYSFPSKNIEYLSSGKPTIAQVLPGMNNIYKEILFEIHGNSSVEIYNKINEVRQLNSSVVLNKVNLAIEYINNNLYFKNVAKRITDILKGDFYND